MLHALTQHIVYHALEYKVPKTQDYKINYATVQYKAISMLCQNIKIADHVYQNALIAQTTYLAFHVLATLHGIIVVRRLYAAAHQDPSAIRHNKMIA